ncbi:MAG: hypothetical protein ABSH09_24690 [Bryobacteraceae bacterium]
MLKIAAACGVAAFERLQAASAQQISSPSGLRAWVSTNGSYQVIASDYGWTFGGTIVGGTQNIVVGEGSDKSGSWTEVSFDHANGRSNAIRLYTSTPVVLFSTTYSVASPNADAFPHLTTYPAGLFTFSYAAPWQFAFGTLNTVSPWLFYDERANAFLFSPATNLLTAVSQMASDGAMEAAIDPQIDSLPAGFTHQSMLAFGTGINNAFDTWGQALTGLTGKQRPANDALTLLEKISYWTDAGAAYYYEPQDATKYIPTLMNVQPSFEALGISIASIELDSWYYPKGSPPSWVNNGYGMDTYQPDPAVFPKGIAAFQESLGLPLTTHARWIDPHSSICATYTMSGNVCIDPRYWQAYASFLASNGVQVLEQDWLFSYAQTAFNLNDPYAFLDKMASAMAAAGRSLVYCMPRWVDILQSTHYDNVVAVRVSPDFMKRAHWDALIFNSRIASAVGLWPFADNFVSTSVKDALLATLTAGPVGAGDSLAAIDADNLRQIVRRDGVIVKPDIPLTPSDATYLAMSTSQTAPVVASTYTDHGGVRTAYVFGYGRTEGAQSPISFTAQSMGIAGAAYVYDYFGKKGSAVEAAAPFTDTVDYNGSYYVVAPIGASGMALIGDAGRFVSCGKKRIASKTDDGVLDVSVSFAAGEEDVVLIFYSPVKPLVEGVKGRAERLVNLGSGLYRVTVSPGADDSASVVLSA